MDKLLNRKKSAEYLNEKGVRSSSVTLARLAMSGEGPKYTLIGRKLITSPSGWTSGLRAR